VLRFPILAFDRWLTRLHRQSRTWRSIVTGHFRNWFLFWLPLKYWRIAWQKHKTTTTKFQRQNWIFSLQLRLISAAILFLIVTSLSLPPTL
jgi:hypothetical protein